MLKIFAVFSIILSLNSNAMNAIKTIEVQGHRGCRGNLPENTLPAFEAAVNMGVDVLEMDVAVTKDNVLVISHDPHISPEICLNADGSKIENAPLIHDLTLEEVKSFDCGSIRHPRFIKQTPIPGTKIPTLAEVFAQVRDSRAPNAKNIRFNIETKIFKEHPEYTVGPDEFSELVVKAFQESGFKDRITLQSFDPRTLVKAKSLDPSIQTVMLIEDGTLDMAALGKMVEAYAISPDFTLLSKELVGQLHEQGFKVIPWTINSPHDWESIIAMDVDGIITDYPQALLEFLEQRGIVNK